MNQTLRTSQSIRAQLVDHFELLPSFPRLFVFAMILDNAESFNNL